MRLGHSQTKKFASKRSALLYPCLPRELPILPFAEVAKFQILPTFVLGGRDKVTNALHLRVAAGGGDGSPTVQLTALDGHIDGQPIPLISIKRPPLEVLCLLPRVTKNSSGQQHLIWCDQGNMTVFYYGFK